MPPCISARITLPNVITITVWGLRIPRKVWASTDIAESVLSVLICLIVNYLLCLFLELFKLLSHCIRNLKDWCLAV